MHLEEVVDILVLLIVLSAFIFLFIKIALLLRKRGGSLTSVMYGATDAFYNRDKRKAIEVVVNKHSNKKQNEQESGKGVDDLPSLERKQGSKPSQR